MTGSDHETDTLRVGVDEAGKGPVLGSMFAASVVADPALLPEDVDDSKQVAPDRREELARTIRDQAQSVTVCEIPVEQIDDPKTDMNTLTVRAHSQVLADVEDTRQAYLDAGDTDADRFGRRVADRLEATFDIRAEHAADERYPIVGAASIIAKVERDAHIAALSAEYGPIGSGYPSDPRTREFLETYVTDHDGLPPCARTSWQTAHDIVNALNQTGLEDC